MSAALTGSVGIQQPRRLPTERCYPVGREHTHGERRAAVSRGPLLLLRAGLLAALRLWPALRAKNSRLLQSRRALVRQWPMRLAHTSLRWPR